jgi:hypothetical protein
VQFVKACKGWGWSFALDALHAVQSYVLLPELAVPAAAVIRCMTSLLCLLLLLPGV